ncbi:MAG TPA: glutamate formimidoyltransferase [Steroidobacteraceae bacterium]|nr:glutamate formimidoyltransferase [Steroidobacteraceae bacterium]
MSGLVECVPNFSEGRDKSVIDAIARAISGASGVRLLDVDPGADTNRTVFTFVGAPDAVAEAAFRGAVAASTLIDMSRHQGAHPRMGALDVCPIVPVSGVSMDRCVEVARALGRRMAEALALPVYFYEFAATRPERRNLADIRAGEYEALEKKLADPAWKPDAGPAKFNARLGATVVGAREFLIAYNVNVNTREQKLANEVALNIREAGRLKRDAKGEVMKDAAGRELRVPGRLKAVKAIGWYIEQYRQAQVSVNLLSFRTTPLHQVYETARDEAAKLGLVVTGSELVGLTPLEPLVEAGRYYLRKQGRSTGLPERELVEIAVQSLGLAQISPFDPDKRIIEYAVRMPGPLVSTTVERFVDEVSSSSPAPGGGSVAALAGSLGAALAAMVANLTVGKTGYESAWESSSTLAERAQSLKAKLLAAVDDDTRAFDEVLAAMRLPKGTDAEKKARADAIAAAYEKATAVPLATARMCLEAIDLAAEAAATGNRNSASDAGVGALLARAGVESAILNVRINLPSVREGAFKSGCVAEIADLQTKSASGLARTLAAVEASLKS